MKEAINNIMLILAFCVALVIACTMSQIITWQATFFLFLLVGFPCLFIATFRAAKKHFESPYGD